MQAFKNELITQSGLDKTYTRVISKTCFRMIIGIFNCKVHLLEIGITAHIDFLS